MQYYFAPLEGITYYNFRQVHHQFFPGIDQYYTPFVVATYTRKMKSREKRDILPENNTGVPVIPQILTNDAEEFLFCAEYMAEFGYSEINLNVGCPVGTVTSKGKGSGLLKEPDRLDALLDGIFNGLERKQLRTFGNDGAEKKLSLSIKTRLGWEKPEEFEKILPVYQRYPVSLLIIHARTRKELYAGEPELDAFARAYDVLTNEKTGMRLCYNGNIRTPEDAAYIKERFSKLDAIMIGRGLLSSPGLVTEIRTGEAGGLETLKQFHNALYEKYRDQFRDDRILVDHMKEVWTYLGASFPASEKYLKAIYRSKKCLEYEAAVHILFSNTG